MRLSKQGLAAVLLGCQVHFAEPESSRNTPYRHSFMRTASGTTLSHLKATWSLLQRRAPTGKHMSSSPLQHCRMGRGSGKISLSCADSKVPVEAGRRPARVLNVPGRAETHSEERSGELRGQAASLLGLQKRAQSQVVGLLPTRKPQQRQECSLWLPHGQSRAAANNTGCQRDGTRL